MNIRRLNPFRKKKLALSFRGGGARGMIYIGVLRALEESGIIPDMLVGSSAGSIVVGAFAAGKSYDSMIDHCEKFSVIKNLDLNAITSFNILDRDKLKQWGEEFIGDIQIEDLKIPTYIQVTNMHERKREIIDSGSLSQWSTASCAFPFLMKQYEINGITYGDGDLTSTHDSKFLRDKGADIVIGFSIKNDKTELSERTGVIERLEEILIIMKDSLINLGEELAPCDMTVDISLPKEFGVLDFHKAADMSEIGYRETLKMIEEIRRVLNLKF